MSERTPRVSIGMPVYNGEQFVAEAFDSLLAQTFADFELIVSDNASTDGTREICRRYVERDSRVRYVRQPENQGAIWNFNHVLELARGTYFKWAASDDLCEPTFLQQCVEVLDANTDVVWCHTQSAKIDETGQRLLTDPEAHEGYDGFVHTSQAGLPRKDHRSPQACRRFAGVLLGTDWCADSYGLVRRDVLLQTRKLPSCYGAEKVLMAELSLHGIYHEVPETLFYQRIHSEASGQLTSEAAQQRFMNARMSKRMAFTRLRLLQGYFGAIRQANLPRWQRWRCYVALVRYLCQVSKWARIVRSTLTRSGIKRNLPGQASNRSRAVGRSSA